MDAHAPLTATDLYRYFQCPYWPYWERFGDPQDRRPLTEAEEERLAEGLEHEQAVVDTLFPVYVKIDAPSADQGMDLTLAQMRAGAPAIYQGWLKDGDWLARPDILERRTGQSAFGDWYYVPIDVKRAHELRKEHKAQMTFYAVLIDRIQNRFPSHPEVINRDCERLTFDADAFLMEFRSIIETLDRIRGGERPDPIYRKSCEDVSPWGAACRRLAEERHDIALLYNVDSRKLQALRTHNVRTIEDAAVLDPLALDGVHPSLTLRALEVVQRQARALLERLVMIRRPFTDPLRGLEIHFDIESYPPADMDYLYGFLIRNAEGDVYKAFTAERIEDEKKMWKAFLGWLETLPALYTVYHFSAYEKQRPLVLARRYGDERHPHLATFLASTVDVSEAVREHAIFPLYFYSLKAINQFLGYRWSGDVKSGGASVLVFDRWRKSGDRSVWDTLMHYNEEDVRATAFLLDWLRFRARDEGVYAPPYPWEGTPYANK